MSTRRQGTVIHFVANIGGGVWSVAKALAAQHRPRWRVVLVAMHKGRLRPAFAEEVQSCFEGAYLVRQPALTGIYYLAPIRVMSVLEALQIDPEHSPTVFHFHTGPFTPWFYRLPRRLPPGKWLACFHGSRGNFGDLHSRAKRWLNRRGTQQLLKRRFTLAAVSHRSASDCATMYGCQASDFRVIHNGTPLPPEPVLRAADQGPHRPFHVGFLGTVMASKGWYKVIAAVAQLRRQGLALHCSIVGDGPDFPALRRLADAYRPWLRAPGHIHAPAENLLPTLDALVLPSEFEGHPEVLLEALSCGVPCICSDVGGCAETIRNGQEGYILRENTPEEIATALRRLISSEELWQQMSAQGRRRHAEQFTTEQMAARWERLYLEDRPAASQRPRPLVPLDLEEHPTP